MGDTGRGGLVLGEYTPRPGISQGEFLVVSLSGTFFAHPNRIDCVSSPNAGAFSAQLSGVGLVDSSSAGTFSAQLDGVGLVDSSSAGTFSAHQ